MSLTILPPLDKRIPFWNPDCLIPRVCPLCGQEGVDQYLRPDGLHIRYCSECSLYFVSPSPTEPELSKYYASYDHSHRNVSQIDGRSLRAQYGKINPNVDYRFQVISASMPLEMKRVLDIGFGRAFFLYFLQKRGAKVTGLELDDWALNVATRDLGIEDVRKVALPEMPQETFDMILMMDLIEHVLHPLSYLTKASAMLNPKGIIAIFTPNASCVARDQAPVLFRVDLEHMNYFSASTLNRIARNLDLEIIHMEQVGSPFLTGIVESSTLLKSRIKALISKTPGFETGYRWWRKLAYLDLSRTGRYHLFAILQKPHRLES